MSETATTAPSNEATPQVNNQQGNPGEELPGLGETQEEGLPENIKEILAKNRRATKEAERARNALQAKVDQFEQERQEAEKAKLSDIERAQAEAQEAVKRAEGAERELLRVRVASQHGITDQDDIELFLTGSDEETITRQAQRLAERQSVEGPATPKPDRTQGASGNPTPTSNADHFAQQLGEF